jgi:glycosyltransferase involved in cell wall biosynthesis
MIRVALLVDVIHSVFGGTERQILELCKNIDRREFELLVACLSKWDHYLDQIEDFGIKTVHLNVERIYDMDGLRKGSRFCDFLKKENVDILMTHHFGSDIWGTVFGHKAKVPIIISNRRDSGFWRGRKHILSYRLLQGWVDKIVVVSQAVKDVVLKEEKVKNEKLVVIHNGIDIYRFNKVSDVRKKKQELHVPPGGKLIGCLGNIRPVKGHKYLLEAAKLIIRDFPHVHFVFVGGGALQQELMDMSRGLGLGNNTLFLGIRKDIPELLDCMDICVLPSLSEGFSNTLLEYMAAGKAIVATNTGGNPEVIVHQKNGLLVNKADSKDLVEKLLSLLGDEENAARLGAQARKDVQKRFSVEKMVESYQTLFKDLARQAN